MATVTVDQSKLVMNAFAATFQNNLVSRDVVTWKKYDQEMNDRNGLTVVEQVGPRYQVTETTDGVADLSGGVQDTVFGAEQFKVNKTFGSSMGWGDFIKVKDIGSARESEAIKNAATNLAEKIDAYVLEAAVNASNNWIGTPANDVSTYGHIAAGYTRLKEEGVEDADLRCILSYADRQALSETIIAYNATDSMSTTAFRKGFQGEVDGIPTMFTQQLPTLTAGTHAGTPLINGASQESDYKDVAVSGAPGQYMTQTIAMDGLGSVETIVAGETFTIADVFAYDNRKGAALTHLQEFTVIDTATASSGAIAALRIFPALIVPASGSGGDVDVNSAHATVSVSPANDAAITFKLTASTAYRPRAIIQKGAVIVNTADLIMPSTGQGMRKSLTKVPLSVRMWKDSDFGTGAHQVRFDVALTANIRDRRRIVRING